MNEKETDVIDTLNPSNDPEFEEWIERSNELAAKMQQQGE